MSLIYIGNKLSKCYVFGIKKISTDSRLDVEDLFPCGNIAAARDMNPSQQLFPRFNFSKFILASEHPKKHQNLVLKFRSSF